MVRIVIGRRPQDYLPIITRNMNSIDTQFSNRRNVALQPGTLQAALLDRLTRTLGKNPDSATTRDIYDALSLAVREELTLRWLATQSPRGQCPCEAGVLFLGRVSSRAEP